MSAKSQQKLSHQTLAQLMESFQKSRQVREDAQAIKLADKLETCRIALNSTGRLKTLLAPVSVRELNSKNVYDADAIEDALYMELKPRNADRGWRFDIVTVPEIHAYKEIYLALRRHILVHGCGQSLLDSDDEDNVSNCATQGTTNK